MNFKVCLFLFGCCVMFNLAQGVESNKKSVVFTNKERIILTKLVAKVLADNGVQQYRNFGYITNEGMRDLLMDLHKNKMDNIITKIIDAIMETKDADFCVADVLLKMLLDLINVKDKSYIKSIAPIIFSRCLEHKLGQFCRPYGTNFMKKLNEAKYDELKDNIKTNILSGKFCHSTA